MSPSSIPRGVIDVSRCLSIKGAEDIIHKSHAFELSTTEDIMFFLADSDKEKEDWINAVGRAIVRHSNSMMEDGAAGSRRRGRVGAGTDAGRPQTGATSGSY